MATEVIDSPLGELRAASTASGGTALSTTAKSYGLPLGTRWLSLYPRNFSTAVVARVSLNPWLTILVSTDNMASVGKLTDVSNDAQDASTSTTITLNSLAAATGEVWMGSHIPFRGAYIDVQNTNSTATTALTVKYWNGASLTSLSVTDGTSSSVSLDQDGSVTWTMPATGAAGLWRADNLNNIVQLLGKNSTGFGDAPQYGTPLYWTQWTWSQNLDSSVSLNSINSLNRSTAYAELASGQLLAQKVKTGFLGIGGFEAATDAGTANLIVNVASLDGTFNA